MDIDTGQANMNEENQGLLTSDVLVNIINYLLLIGAILAVIAKDDKTIISSAYVKLIAGFLSIAAALVESNEQQIAPGVTTPLNRMKTAGSVVSIIGALILTYVLLRETALRQAGITPPSAPISPFISPAFV